jgi:Flp pilus assembly protein TadG
MSRHRNALTDERGFALFYLAVFLTVLLIFVGLAVDTGRAYVVQAQLSKAVDGAALGAARMLNSGNPAEEAGNIYRANFPVGWMGTTSSTNPSESGFFTMTTDTATGVNVVNVAATAVVPTTFMKLANFQQMTVNAQGEATRRMVDLSLVLDVSSSIGSKWGAVRDASRSFVDGFAAAQDRVALIFYSNGARVVDAMPAGRGFDKARVMSDIPNSLPGGSTAMVEGLYRGWDEMRSVPNGQQSGLRVIVLFTDGASNSVPGVYPGSPTSRGLRTYDFPERNDPDNQTHDYPTIAGLYDTQSGTGVPNIANQAYLWSDESLRHTTVLWLPPTSFHSYHRSSGIPTSFPLSSTTLMVDGASQRSRRPLRNTVGATAPPYRTSIHNINNAARNLVEIIANEARSDDDGDYPIRIYTIGMGSLVRLQLGTRPETSESMLKRVANDITSPDYNGAQLEGKYYFAETEAHVAAAFQALQNQIIRLTK